MNKRTSSMNHEQRTSDQASKSFERGARLTGFCKCHGLDTGSKSKKYMFYMVFLFRDNGSIKGNLSNSFYSNCSYNHGVRTLNN